MLASVMLKMGTYGLVRFCLTLFPDAARQAAPVIGGLAICGIIYGALVALVQPNMKKLVAYSSVSHLGFVVLGLFSYQRLRVDQFPDVTFPIVVVQTEYPGAAPETVETDITRKVEEAVNTISGINSFLGFSSTSLNVTN